MSAQQVVRDEMGQEVVMSFGKAPMGVPASSSKKPRYLDEDEAEDPQQPQNDQVNGQKEEEKKQK